MAGGGFESKRVSGAFPSTKSQAIAVGDVTSVNKHKGDVTLTAGDVGAFTKGEATSRFEQKRATGVVGGSTDVNALKEGDYYVTEKFTDSPVITSGNYVGVINVNLDFDGGNGGLMAYHADGKAWFKIKYASGVWDSKWNPYAGVIELSSWSYQWNSPQSTQTSAVIGQPITMTESNPVPAGSSLDGMKHKIGLEFGNAATATISGNVVTTTAAGWLDLIWEALNGQRLIQSVYIAALGDINKDTPPVIPLSSRMAALSGQEKEIESRLSGMQRQINKLEHNPAPNPAGFDQDAVELTGGYADNWRDAILVSTHKIGSPITIKKTGSDPHNAIVMMSQESAKHVAGITINGGLAAKWESHAVTIGDKQYMAFISPYKLTKSPLDIGIAWSKTL